MCIRDRTDLVPDSEEKAGTQAVERAKEQALDAIAMVRIFSIFTGAGPKSAEPDDKSGYNKQERGAMERLIQSYQ